RTLARVAGAPARRVAGNAAGRAPTPRVRGGRVPHLRLVRRDRRLRPPHAHEGAWSVRRTGGPRRDGGHHHLVRRNVLAVASLRGHGSSEAREDRRPARRDGGGARFGWPR